MGCVSRCAEPHESLSQGSGGFIAVVALGLSFIATVARGAAEPATKIDHASLFADDDMEDLPPSLRRARPAGLASPSALRAAATASSSCACTYSKLRVVSEGRQAHAVLAHLSMLATSRGYSS